MADEAFVYAYSSAEAKFDSHFCCFDCAFTRNDHQHLLYLNTSCRRDTAMYHGLLSGHISCSIGHQEQHGVAYEAHRVRCLHQVWHDCIQAYALGRVDDGRRFGELVHCSLRGIMPDRRFSKTTSCYDLAIQPVLMRNFRKWVRRPRHNTTVKVPWRRPAC
ncbi:uncharacterized protein MYCFIDRAFT_179842 [Pseudocercospora fijiensis CIRAD86]|uniref:Uncharacterized protein n=1 Tax=Pseudocercospora fijiensis (strain CIRAD86) TaxID=383855 RepID=M2YHJ1_PSEFD|nr:uncharacterized protein MYCFIDRAFT_179842 [Pseudocercospora fijiensis CIRAD86]EME77260.1 hypothetical protein MYCFIDRAFT_179842 [Pseudocercospora fijiensis CIRAD86]